MDVEASAMRHVPFPKIPVASSAAVADNGIWIATEKIHGAQLVIAYDGREFRIGKRKAWLRGEEAFFGWQLLRGELEQAAGRHFREAVASVHVDRARLLVRPRGGEPDRSAPTTFERETLEIAPGEWIVQVLRASYPTEDTPIHVLETICAASRHIFSIGQVSGYDEL
ncbi:hypothetical protein AB0H88_00090 [Nonomuraea sp. NPDC050680]|uniref:hypothetical protein n=1 Tax=Nonomuraea sp. NPDC050680 TaxID=3154630 RepID=UPI0033FE60C2